MKVLGRDVVGLLPVDGTFSVSALQPDVFRDPGVEDRRRTDAECDAADCAGVGRV